MPSNILRVVIILHKKKRDEKIIDTNGGDEMVLPEEFYLCTKCKDGLAREEGETPVPGDGSPTAKIMFIGESAGAEEMKHRKPFQGKAGENLNEFLKIIGLERKGIYISNTTRCRPYQTKVKTLKDGTVKITKSNRPPGKQEILACAPWLDYEIARIEPEILIPLGSVPLNRIIGPATISKVHGRLLHTPIQYFDVEKNQLIFTTKKYHVFPLYHPASIIYRKELKDVFISDLNKLKDVLIQLQIHPSE
jgi:uracil-DNA glycosylase family 4